MSNSPSTEATPAGWFPQPDGQQRYWDGQQWTEHFAPGTQPATAPPIGPVGKPTRPWFKKKRVILPVAALVVIGFASALGGDPSSTPKPAASQSQPGTTEAAAPPPAEEAAPVPETPSYAGDFDGEYGTFTQMNKSGRGDMTITLPDGASAGLVIATHKGSANFIVGGLDAQNQSTSDGLVNEIGNYKGTTAFGLNGLGEKTEKLQVTADGKWTIKIVPISSAPVLPSSATGKGDKVYRYESGAADVAITHKGSSNFIVNQYGGDMSLGVNEIGNYSGTVPFVAGPTVLVIQADGRWTLKQQD